MRDGSAQRPFRAISGRALSRWAGSLESPSDAARRTATRARWTIQMVRLFRRRKSSDDARLIDQLGEVSVSLFISFQDLFGHRDLRGAVTPRGRARGRDRGP